MEKLDSTVNIFKQLESGDELTIFTGQESECVRNNTVLDDTPLAEGDLEKQYILEPVERGKVLVCERENIELKDITREGYLEVKGEKVVGIINHTQETWGGRKRHEKYV